LKKKREPRKRRIKNKKSSLTKKLETRRSMKLNSKLKESRTRRREKFKDLESSKRRLLIDKLRSMR
jgi:hypothetical protein